MPSPAEFGARLNMPVQTVIDMVQLQVQNPNSAAYKAIEDKVAKKLAALKAQETVETQRKRKMRVYIQHAVPAQSRYALAAEFPQWDIHFSGVDKRSAAYTYATMTLVTEFMISQTKMKTGSMLMYGVDLRQIVLRNRHWAHLCVPGYSVNKQREFIRQDRAIVSVVQSQAGKNVRDAGLPLDYAQGTKVVHCTMPHLCKETASVAVMNLHGTDTNFRQIAYYMLQHGVKLCFISVFGNKHMEFNTEGDFPEQSAKVFPTGGGTTLNLCFDNDSSLNASYTHHNYLELVARTQIVLGDVVFQKEFVARKLGMLVYKITSFSLSDLNNEIPIYRSWIEPNYRDLYSVSVPLLRHGGSVHVKADWTIENFFVPRSLVDDMVDYAMRVHGEKDSAKQIERRLFTMTSNYVFANQILKPNNSLAVTNFDALVLMIYCTTFMGKYEQGATVATLAPEARHLAAMSGAGPMKMFWLYFKSCVASVSKPLSMVAAIMRDICNEFDQAKDLPLPSFSITPGYVEYTDKASDNPRFAGWDLSDPTTGFTSLLPGVAPMVLQSFDDLSVVDVADDHFDINLILTGHAFYDEGSLVQESSDKSTVLPLSHDYALSQFEYQESRRNPNLVVTQPQRLRPQTDTVSVDQLVSKISEDHNNLEEIRNYQYSENKVFQVGTLPDLVQGGYSDHPLFDIHDALNTIFPGTSTMFTEFFEADKHYSDSDINVSALKLKFDVSKIEPLKPERVFKPKIRGHVQPNVKNNFENTIRTIAKRNADTPADADPMNFEFMWGRLIRAYLQVYCVPDAQRIVDSWDYAGPTKDRIREWVSKLPDEKRHKLDKESDLEGFALFELQPGIRNNAFMLKGKLKPDMTSAFSTSLKLPQSIQFDQTGKSVAVYAPLIAHKVDRAESIYKHNVLVMQRKSVEELNTFLNGFDHRPDERGERYYIEGDYTMYDKSQNDVCEKMYWNMCSFFKLLPQMMEFLSENSTYRSVSSLKAGIKAFLRHQNPSGFPFTLDRNNDVNMLVMSQFLLTILSQIEFIILLGDDIVIAVRGKPDVSSWESEINRLFNLSTKIAIHKVGYICGMVIAHLPRGHSRAVFDPVKNALKFMQQTDNTKELLHERFVSYRDNSEGIQDANVQYFLAIEFPQRLSAVLPETTYQSILLLCKAHAKLRQSFAAFSSMVSDVSTLIHY